MDVTPAELKTTREALGLSSEWVAEAGGVAVRTIRHWESGAARVPDDIADLLNDLARQVRAHIDSSAARTESGPVTLLRYRDQEALQQATGLRWPVATHAIAQLRAIEVLRDHGVTARLLWFDPAEYGAWAQNRSEASPEQWAAVQPWERKP